MVLKLIFIFFVFTSSYVSKTSAKTSAELYYEYLTFIRPISYDLHLFITGREEFRNYDGVLKIQFASLTNSTYFKLASTSSSYLTNVQLTNLNTSQIIDNVSYHQDGYSSGDTHYTFKVDKNVDIIKESEVYQLDLNFTRSIQLNYADKAVIMNKYKVNNVTKYFAFTRFKAEFSVQLIPIIFEENLNKTPIKFRITHQPIYTALSNMPGRVVLAKDNLVTTIFQETPPMTGHQLAFVIGEFQSRSVPNSHNYSFTMHGSSELDTKSIDAVQRSGNILNELGNYLQTLYPLSKLDFFIYPDNVGVVGVEHLGLILFEESQLFGDFKTEKTKVLMNNVILNADHLSRQYFGDLVTPKIWQFYWLTQGLSTFFSYFILDRAFPGNNYIDQFILDNMYKSFELYSHDHRVNLSPEQMTFRYINDETGKYKASSILRMLQHMVGDDVFRKAIIRYVSLNVYGSTTPDDLIKAFKETLDVTDSWPIDINIDSVINSWLNLTGLPILNVKRDYVNHNIVLEQNYSGSQDNLKSQQWWIAYNYATKSSFNFEDTKPIGWMKQESRVSFDLNLKPNQWIIFNKQYTNLYVVNYDEQNWNLIIDELIFGDFERVHVFNRAQIINDLNYLVKWNKIDRKILIKSLFYLRRETNYLPWATADIVLEDFWKLTLSTKYAISFKKLLYYITSVSYDIFRTNITVNESKESLLTRPILVKWACRAGYHNCLQDMDTLSLEYLNSLNQPETLHVHPDLKNDLFCFGFQNEADYNTAFDYFLGHPEHPDESIFFKHFGCKKNTTLFRKYYFIGMNQKVNEYPGFDKIFKQIFRTPDLNLIEIFYYCLIESCYDFQHYYLDIYPQLSQQFVNENDLSTMRLILNHNLQVYGNETIVKFNEYIDNVKDNL